MFLNSEAANFLEKNKSVRVGLIGAGKFGSMFLSQIPTTHGFNVSFIVDLSPDQAKKTYKKVGCSELIIEDAIFSDVVLEMIEVTDIDVIVEATGDSVAGVKHVLA